MEHRLTTNEWNEMCEAVDEVTGAVCGLPRHPSSERHRDARDPNFEVAWSGDGKIPRLVLPDRIVA